MRRYGIPPLDFGRGDGFVQWRTSGLIRGVFRWGFSVAPNCLRGLCGRGVARGGSFRGSARGFGGRSVAVQRGLRGRGGFRGGGRLLGDGFLDGAVVLLLGIGTDAGGGFLRLSGRWLGRILFWPHRRLFNGLRVAGCVLGAAARAGLCALGAAGRGGRVARGLSWTGSQCIRRGARRGAKRAASGPRAAVSGLSILGRAAFGRFARTAGGGATATSRPGHSGGCRRRFEEAVDVGCEEGLDGRCARRRYRHRRTGGAHRAVEDGLGGFASDHGVSGLIGLALVGVSWVADAVMELYAGALLNSMRRFVCCQSQVRWATKGDAIAHRKRMGPHPVARERGLTAHTGCDVRQVMAAERLLKLCEVGKGSAGILHTCMGLAPDGRGP